MADAEKVLKGLDQCLDSSYLCGLDGGSNPDCPYHEYKRTCMIMLMRDAHRVIKEQQDEIESLKQTAQGMMEGIVVSTPAFYPCASCQDYHCDFCEYKKGG